METNMQQLTEQIQAEGQFMIKIYDEIGKVIVGQRYMVERLLLGILADGHVLVEGVPGLAKTTAMRAMGDATNLDFSRIQFTPDMLPADIIGTQIYNAKTAEFAVKKGPIFHNIILADEINRAPSKVQSALLEAMQEKQVTIGNETFQLDQPFLVMATQNPLEQEGTYPLPEAQIDRFMFKLNVTYSTMDEEVEIVNRMAKIFTYNVQSVLNAEDIIRLRDLADKVYVDDRIRTYIVNLVFATRDPMAYKIEKLKHFIYYGASPRATIWLAKAAKVYAFMNGRGYVTPQDIKTIAPDVLRHRIIMTYEAEAEGYTTDNIVQDVLSHIDVP